MPAICTRAELDIDVEDFDNSFNREPFGLHHNLSELDLFEPDSLRELAAKYSEHPLDHYVAASAPTPGANFYSVPYTGLTPRVALDHLDSRGCRVLMKRPEVRFAVQDLLDSLFKPSSARGAFAARVLQLESAVLISSVYHHTVPV